MRWVRLGVICVVVLVVAWFAMSNRGAVTISFWPTSLLISLPLWLAILGAMGVAFLAGGALASVDGIRHRGRARRAERRVQLLEQQLDAATLRHTLVSGVAETTDRALLTRP